MKFMLIDNEGKSVMTVEEWIKESILTTNEFIKGLKGKNNIYITTNGSLFIYFIIYMKIHLIKIANKH